MRLYMYMSSFYGPFYVFCKSNMIVDNFLNLGVNSFDKFNDRLIQEPLGAKVPTKIISLK